MLINQPQQMVPWDLIFQPEIVKQRFRAGVLAHHEPESSDNGDAQQHGQTMLLNTSHCHTDLTQISLIRTHFFNTHAIVHSASMPSSQPSRLPTGRKELERDSWAMNSCGQLRNAAVGIETSWS